MLWHCCIESTCRLAKCPSVVTLCIYTVYSEWPLLFEGIACPFAIQESLARRRACLGVEPGRVPFPRYFVFRIVWHRSLKALCAHE